MTLAELELRSAAAHTRLGDARANLSAALTPSRILDTGFGAAMSGARRLMPEATKRIAGDAGKSITTIAIGALASFIASRLTRQPQRRATTGDHHSQTAADTVARQATGTSSQSRQGSISNGDRIVKLAKTAAGGAFALYLGSMISRQIKPTVLECHLTDRYGAGFSSFYSKMKSELPTTLLRSSGIGGKASAALLAVSALATLFKELDAATTSKEKAA